MIKTIFVPATFKVITKEVEEEIPTGEVKKSWLGGQKPVMKKVTTQKAVGWSSSEIDGQKLSEDINLEIEKWTAKNAKIISITPITSGRYNYKYSSKGISSSPRILLDTEKVSGGGSYGFGFGYSYTEGVLICIEI